MKWTVPRQEKYPALPGFSSQPAQNRPVRSAQLTLFTPLRHLDVDYHSMLYLFYVLYIHRKRGELATQYATNGLHEDNGKYAVVVIR